MAAPDEGYWCQYATDWTEVKMEWGLTMTQRETEAVIVMLDTCEEPVDVKAKESGRYRRNGLRRGRRQQRRQRQHQH